MKKVRKNVTGRSIWLNRMKPSPKIVMPTRMSRRGPKRSVSQPWTGRRRNFSRHGRSKPT
jgi:hypothetical protein